MFCPYCGNEQPDGTQFCGSCGARIAQDAVGTLQGASSDAPASAQADQTQSAPAPAQPEIAAASAPVSDAQAPVQAPVQAPAQAPALVPKKSKKMPIIIAAAAAIVVIAVVAIVYFAMFAPYAIDERTFPDTAVRTALADRADVNHDGAISRDEAAELTTLDLSGSGVSRLDGLDRFPNLSTLNLANTASLLEADFGQVKNLNTLILTNSSLGSINVSMLSNLKSLRADNSEFTTIDVSSNPSLTELSLDDDVVVTGLDSTGLRAQFLVTKQVGSGIDGSLDGQGGGNIYDERELELEYDENCNLIGFTRNDSSSSFDDSSRYGRRYTWEGGLLTSSEATGTTYGTDADFYYEDGRLVEVDTVWRSSSSDSYTDIMYDYDSSGRLASKTTEYYSDSDPTIMTYSYNDAGQLTEAATRSDSYESAVDLTYDKAGRLATLSTGWQEFEFDYNDAGQLAKKAFWYLDDKGKRSGSSTEVAFAYDDTGRVTEAKRKFGDNDDWECTATVTYDENGLVKHIDRHYSYKSGKKVTEDYGTEDFEYHRVFTAVDAADVVLPIVLGDPTMAMKGNYPVRFDLIDAGIQSPIAVQVCDQMIYSGVVL